MVPSGSSSSCPSVEQSLSCPSWQPLLQTDSAFGDLHSAPTSLQELSQLLLPGGDQSLGHRSALGPSRRVLPPSVGTPGLVPLGAPPRTQPSRRGERASLSPQHLPGFYVPLVLQGNPPPHPAPKQAVPPTPQLGCSGGSSKILSRREVWLVLQDPALGGHPDPHPRWARPPSCLPPSAVVVIPHWSGSVLPPVPLPLPPSPTRGASTCSPAPPQPPTEPPKYY